MRPAPRSASPRLRPIARATVLLLAGAAAGSVFAQANDADTPRPQDDGVRIGTIVITGQGDKLGAGQMLKEDATKARSTVTRAATEKDRATGNSFQAMALLPGVNTFNHDATGLFGGGISVRGFTADQMGVTINGVPVNDSGSYSVFPQEYADQENLCIQTLAPGAPDVESPHIGSSGGSIGIISCDPEDKRRVRVSQTVGQLKLSRTFLRVDTGRFANDMAKVFASFSHSETDKWKGPGTAKRDHIDAAFSLDINPNARVVGSILYNKAINNNYLTMSLAQLKTNGYFWDYTPTFPGHATPRPGVTDTDPSPNPQYYKLSINPFENAIASLSGSFRLSENTNLKVQPYFWYGYGTGSNQQRLQSEGAFLNAATGKLDAKVDLNGDGDYKDSVIVANSSVTRTRRPGITAELTHILGAHQLKFGLWYEHTEHKQTGPMVLVDNAGNPLDPWLRSGWVTRPDGKPFESRDWVTVSPAYQAYVADTMNFDSDKGTLTLGLRTPHITRKFTNTANEFGGTALTSYTFEKSYSELLPQLGLRYNFTKEHQVFFNVGKNFRAPPNFAFAPSNGNIQIENGQPVLKTAIDAETAIAIDLGYRFQGKDFTASATVFNVDFKNRQSNAYDPQTDKNVYTNAGKTTKRGLEVEAGSAVFGGFSAYVSATVQEDKLKNDLQVAKNQLLPTTGKSYALTPKYMMGGSLQYAAGPLYLRLKAKYTGKQWATLMNDEEVPSYTLIDFDAGYKFADMGMLKSPLVRLNVSNLGNMKYRNPSSTSAVTNAVAVPLGAGNTRAAQNVFYYMGAPRFASVTFSADFQ